MDEQTTKTWAIVELMGHRKMAGMISMDQSFGPALTRVDVPETSKHPGFTQHFGAAAIYAITACSEETAKAFNEMHRHQPIDQWDARSMLLQLDQAEALPAPVQPPDFDEVDEYEQGEAIF